MRENCEDSMFLNRVGKRKSAGQIWLSAREKVSVYAAFLAVMRSKSVRGCAFCWFEGLGLWLKRVEFHVRKQREFDAF